MVREKTSRLERRRLTLHCHHVQKHFSITSSELRASKIWKRADETIVNPTGDASPTDYGCNLNQNCRLVSRKLGSGAPYKRSRVRFPHWNFFSSSHLFFVSLFCLISFFLHARSAISMLKHFSSIVPYNA